MNAEWSEEALQPPTPPPFYLQLRRNFQCPHAGASFIFPGNTRVFPLAFSTFVRTEHPRRCEKKGKHLRVSFFFPSWLTATELIASHEFRTEVKLRVTVGVQRGIQVGKLNIQPLSGSVATIEYHAACF